MEDEPRYGTTPRRQTLLLGIPCALAMMTIGGYWTLLDWGVLDAGAESRATGALGPILAGLGVALAYVCLRPRR